MVPINEAKKHEERKYEETMSHTIKLNTKKRVRFEKWLRELI